MLHYNVSRMGVKSTLLMAGGVMRTIIVFCLLLLAGGTGWGAEPRVVVSIKPIHSLVAGVMQGVAEPQLLIAGGGSPHGYVLRPSEARALADADLVIWVGHNLESFLEKPLATLGRKASQLELMDRLEADLLPLRAGGDWEGHGHAAEEERGHHGHQDLQLNPHLWLSPQLAKKVVEVVRAALIEVDPSNGELYRQNAGGLLERLEQLDARLRQKLAPVSAVPYLVFHDAYQYFEAAYGLNAVGSVTVDPERRPGIKRLLEMREKIKELNARCVFSEPQFEPKLVATIIEGTGARTGELDPLGAELAPGAEHYFQLLNALADDLLRGLH